MNHRYLLTRMDGLSLANVMVVEAETTDNIESAEELLDEVKDSLAKAYRKSKNIREAVDYACGDCNVADIAGLEQELVENSSCIKSLSFEQIILDDNNCWNFDTILFDPDLEDEDKF